MNKKTKLLTLVAKMYYFHEMSQQEIAENLGFSRTYIGKLLIEAKNAGVVQVRINDPFNQETDLEKQLRLHFHLSKAIAVPVPDSKLETLKHTIAEAAASYLDSIIRDGDTIGVTWGTYLQAISEHIHPHSDLKNVNIVQLCGGINSLSQQDNACDIPKSIATALNGNYMLIPTPTIVETLSLKNALLREHAVTSVIQTARKANIALFTAGTMSKTNTLVRAGYFSDQELDELLKKGAVSDVCTHILDKNGVICDPVLDQKTIAVSYEDFKRIPIRIGICAGSENIEAARAALTASCFTVFITNETMARALLSTNPAKTEVTFHHDRR